MSVGILGIQRPETSDQRPETRDQRPATSDQRPATSNQRPATSNQRQAAATAAATTKTMAEAMASASCGIDRPPPDTADTSLVSANQRDHHDAPRYVIPQRRGAHSQSDSPRPPNQHRGGRFHRNKRGYGNRGRGKNYSPFKPKQVRKIYVLVCGKGIDYMARERDETRGDPDTAGKHLTIIKNVLRYRGLTDADIAMHRETPHWYRPKKSIGPVEVLKSNGDILEDQYVPLSRATGPWCWHQFVERYIRSNIRENGPFLAPAYPCNDNPNLVLDTQLCVSGKVEKYDVDPVACAIREIKEEIGVLFEPYEISPEMDDSHVDKNGNEIITHCFIAKRARVPSRRRVVKDRNEGQE